MSSSPVAPAPAPSPPLPAESTVSGTVYEHTATGFRPVPGFKLRPYGLSDARPAELVTDALGRYFAGFRGGASIALYPGDDGYLVPCGAATWVPEGADRNLDVHVVSLGTLTLHGQPNSLPLSGRTLSGRVYELTATGTRPVTNVVLSWSDGWETEFGTTATGPTGRYVLCGVQNPAVVYAYANGYRRHSAAVDASVTELDVELVRE